jgi:phosphoribosyl 1,2-cyclic phosphodiesterase
MGLRFTVLASGSAGNVNVLHSAASAILLDVGLQRSVLLERLASAGLAHVRINSLVLTHTHGDHWNDSALAWLYDQNASLFCHPSHHLVLSRSSAFRGLVNDGRVKDYAAGVEFSPAPGMRALPIPVRHDGGATFAFRIEGPADLFGAASVVGHATDLGTWDEELADHLADADLLAVEFNHDLEMEKRSPRPAFLIQRVLGDHGHLSNCQAAALLRAVIARGAGRLRHVVQLHLSSDCNRPSLARQSARNVLNELGCDARVHTAAQNEPLKTIVVSAGVPTRNRSPRSAPLPAPAPHPLLPGLEA